jgi:hypothetical protein
MVLPVHGQSFGDLAWLLLLAEPSIPSVASYREKKFRKFSEKIVKKGKNPKL